MKHIALNFSICCIAVLTALCLSSCHDRSEENTVSHSDEAKVYFIFTLDTSGGSSMRRAPKTNAEVFDVFYSDIQNGNLVAPTYELTLTEISTGAVSTFTGQWANHDCVTLRTGMYRVEGRSTATGNFIQDRCSFVFDETVSVVAGMSSVTLHPDYNCFLLVFGGEDFASLENHSGSDVQALFPYGDYHYAFVNGTLYDEAKKEEACITGSTSSGSLFKIPTGNLAFERGKYYVYNSLTNSFDVPRMDEGDEDGGNGIGDDNGESSEEEGNGNSGGEISPVDMYAYEMVAVPAGTFLMGSPDDLTDASDDERPQHSVSLPSFQIGKYEVTQQLWKSVMGTNPSYFQGSKVKTQNLTRPVEMVSKEEVEQFITKLNELTGLNYRLPTEEEWEYAARGGTSSAWLYAGSNDITSVAWYSTNSSSETHPVADKSKNPNALGIYGMSGNVYEWTSSPRTDSYEAGAAVNTSQYVVRGGSFQNGANSCRVAYRNFVSPNERRNYLGLRLVKD